MWSRRTDRHRAGYRRRHADRAVNGHFAHPHQRPWALLDEFVNNGLARIVGAEPAEVIAMNTLTVNLHILLVTFYTPTSKRFKVLLEHKAFPSDHVRARARGVHAHGGQASLRREAHARPARRSRALCCHAEGWLGQYAIESCVRNHGFDPKQAMVLLQPRAGEATLRPEDILAAIEVSAHCAANARAALLRGAVFRACSPRRYSQRTGGARPHGVT